MILQIISKRYFAVTSRFVSFLHLSNRAAAADESPPVLAFYRIQRSDMCPLLLSFLPFKTTVSAREIAVNLF
jgi:hypothetical protein